MYRSIRNSHIPPRAFDSLPCPGRGEFDGPQRTWGGALDNNTRGVGNLIRCLDFMFRAALRIKTVRVCLQTLKQLPDPSVIIVESIFNVADVTFLFVTFGKTLETDISAQIISDFWRKSGPDVEHLITEFSLDVGHLNEFLAPGVGTLTTTKLKSSNAPRGGGGGFVSFELIGTLLCAIIRRWTEGSAEPRIGTQEMVEWRDCIREAICDADARSKMGTPQDSKELGIFPIEIGTRIF